VTAAAATVSARVYEWPGPGYSTSVFYPLPDRPRMTAHRKLEVAVQMDPIERIRIAGDSTFALLLEAQARGHSILHYTPDRLRLNGTRVEAMAEPKM